MIKLTDKEQKTLLEHFEEKIPNLCIADDIIKEINIESNKKYKLLDIFSKICNDESIDINCATCCLEFFKLILTTKKED